MAKCQVCGQEMLTAFGCKPKFLIANGKRYARIPMGAKGDFFENAEPFDRCGDCGAHKGGYHHWGCDSERCPACGHQLLSCECKNVYAEDSE